MGRFTRRLVGIVGTAAVLVAAATAQDAGDRPATAAAAAVSGATSPALASIAIDNADRASVRRSYLDVLRPAVTTPIGWTGSVSGCVAGAPSAATQSATLTTVNWVRELAGVTPVTFDPSLSAKAQAAALMMEAEGRVSHTPGTDWACYSEAGATGANKSNLALGSGPGFAGATAVLAWMAEPGSNNTSVGHRRWILDPRQQVMGAGSTSRSSALYVVGSFASWDVAPAWMAWPTAGYFPWPLEPDGRWSLSIDDVWTGVSDVTVTVTTADGTPLPVSVYPVHEGYGADTVVFEVDLPGEPYDWEDDAYDDAFTVSASMNVGGTVRSTSYTVTLFDPALAGPPLFTDVDGRHPFYEAIDWMVDRAITNGYTDGTFRPGSPLQRQAMAAFLWRYAGSPPPEAGPPAFVDVGPGHPFFAAIQWMAQTGLSNGTLLPDGTRRFDPGATLQRQAMAAFLHRLAGAPPPSATTPSFGDVGTSHPFFAAVQWMAQTGLSNGTPQPTGLPLFKPGTPLNRQAMAAFLARYDANVAG